MRVETPDTEAAADIADLWVDLAREQRRHDSHILPERNRTQVADDVARGIVADRVRVARTEDGEVAGFVTFSTVDGLLETATTRGTVENLYVRPEDRGRGIGGDLLEAATAALRDRGVDAVKLEVMADNEAARRFYRRHGFEPHRVEMERRVESDTHSKDGA